MKKIWFTLMIFTLLLSACGSNTTTAGDATSGSSTTKDSAPANGQYPEITKILLGSFLLEDTNYAITSEQANTLLPLWKGLNALLSSDTVTEMELNGLYKQIEDAMTKDQLAQIDSMNINQDSMRTVMEKIGFGGLGNANGTPEPGSRGNLTQDQIATFQAQRQANGGTFTGRGQGGGFPGGGQGGFTGGGQGGNTTGRGGVNAAGTLMPTPSGDPTLRMMSRLIEPLIQLLQKKISG